MYNLSQLLFPDLRITSIAYSDPLQFRL